MTITRRQFLARGTSVLGAGAALAAGSRLGLANELRPLRPQLSGPVTLQLGWLANVENMGPYVAQDLGDYTRAGVQVNIVPGGPSVTSEPLVVSGKAFTALDSVDTIARARLQGAPLKVVAVTLQKNPSAVMSLASKPIRNPHELIGKRLGIQQSGVEIYNAFFQMNGINPKKVTYVPVQFDPAPLVDGKVDAFASFQTSQPVELALQGVKTVTFLLSDFGYNIWGDSYYVTEATLKDKKSRTELVELLRGSIAGWKKACADPAFAAKVVTDKFGKSLGLTLKSQELTAKYFVPLIETPWTRAHGLLSMSPEGIDQNMRTMRAEKIHIAAKELFDTSVIEEALA